MTRAMIHVAAFVALACCQPAFGLEEQELAGFLDNARDELRLPGLRAAVRFPDGRIVRAAVGLADKKANTPLDNRVGMPGGSTGKTFVAALTMLLVEDGTLSLDDPAKKWLGDTDWFARLPNSGDILVRHLLSHSAGLGDYPGKPAFIIGMAERTIRKGSAYFELPSGITVAVQTNQEDPTDLVGVVTRIAELAAADRQAKTQYY